MFKHFEAHIDGPIASEARAIWTSGGYIHFKRAIFYNVRVAAAGMPELSSGCFRILDESPPGFVMAFTESPGCCAADLFFSPLGGVRDLQKVWDWSGSEVIRFSWWDGAVRILRPALWSWFLPGWWWLEPWNFMTFQKQLGIIYNPNCYSLIFLRRVVKNHQPVTHGGHVCRGTTSPAHKSRCGFRLSTEC